MSELKEFDDTVHDEDEYETPKTVYDNLCLTYQVYPQLDVASDQEGQNSKCRLHLLDALKEEWNYNRVTSVWCNPPHSKTEEFVNRAQLQWNKHNINILMIVPANSICAHYFDDILQQPFVEYFRISGRITFLRNGKLTKYPSRNSYFVVIWRAVDP